MEWHFNTPLASHSVGIWERMIRSIRRILSAVMDQQVVDDEAFQTFLIEGQPDDLDPLTPSKLLLLRSNSCVPPGIFVDGGIR